MWQSCVCECCLLNLPYTAASMELMPGEMTLLAASRHLLQQHASSVPEENISFSAHTSCLKMDSCSFPNFRASHSQGRGEDAYPPRRFETAVFLGVLEWLKQTGRQTRQVCWYLLLTTDQKTWKLRKDNFAETLTKFSTSQHLQSILRHAASEQCHCQEDLSTRRRERFHRVERFLFSW